MTPSHVTSRYAIIDVEVGLKDHKIHDIGAFRNDGATFHETSREALFDFLQDVDYLCGHNIIHHDAKHLFANEEFIWKLVDTLYLSPLLFPERPYHKLVKDDKLISEQMNNPVNDCKKAYDLLQEEISSWELLPPLKRKIFTLLLKGQTEFDGFLHLVGENDATNDNVIRLIRQAYAGKICQNKELDTFIQQYPIELAYALALIDTTDYRSVTPGWVLHNYPYVEYIVKSLRHTHCPKGCTYCNAQLDVRQNLKTFFGYSHFRTYDGEALQEKAAQAAVNGESLLAIFPTGGGKSLTFQLPALIAGRAVHGLTVVISPLQSLMKDQVDNLNNRGITDAITINGLLDPLTRSQAIQQVLDGDASLLYISPEMLRSKTIERILTARHIVRFVIDEAHCFSSWGQDFRVDYLYIGKFIKEYQQKKSCAPIPVSCFTATAKQKVIQDICDYFKQTLGLDLKLFASTATRTNLRYTVTHAEDDNDKYARLRDLIDHSHCPAIIYVSRTKRTKELASKLTRDGYKALPFNGQMEADEKIANQNAFMNDSVRIIVATSAFGMGVDKKDVGLVIHYDISDSLENYVQEAGRAGRDPEFNASCHVLYSDNDLDKHFVLLNQTKLSISEIQQIWNAVKYFTKQRLSINCSALEIARQAGWDDSVSDIETRVRTALATLEQGGYLVRGNNIPHVYATGITVNNVEEARIRITKSPFFDDKEIEKAIRIIRSLISQKYIAKAQDSEAESRIDYLADILGLSKREVLSTVERMRQEGILADSKDISAYLSDIGSTKRKALTRLDYFAQLEEYILLHLIPDDSLTTSYKKLNDAVWNDGDITTTEKDIRTLLYFLTIKGYIFKKEEANRYIEIRRQANQEITQHRFEKRLEISRFSVEWLYRLALKTKQEVTPQKTVQFSIVELLNQIKSNYRSFFNQFDNLQLEDVEEALLYLQQIDVLKLEGGFLVLYNAMHIQRIKDNKAKYKLEDYRMLNEFYKHKIQQVHIVGEYANLMVKDYQSALRYVQDYFQMDYKKFITKYFKGERINEIQRNITSHKYQQLFGQLSKCQMEIISDKDSRYIVVAAGPGSGKTRVLVHKLASLLLLEDVKHEQLLMLTFSRAAAIEFKLRLMELIGNAAHFVEITTFHSYCFNLLGRIGTLEDSDNVIPQATEMINQGEVELNKIRKMVLVIDEAQDMSSKEYSLVKALIDKNEDMRIIAVGDDDQNIYGFRGSNSKYMFQLTKEPGSKFVEMTENYRSARHIVNYANEFAKNIRQRIKVSPIMSVSKDDGWVEITHHQSEYMYHPIVNDITNHKPEGSSCILTHTNEEAAILESLLKKHGRNAKLIQSTGKTRLYNMAEMRHLIKFIDKRLKTSFIPDELWEEAKQDTFFTYKNSQCLPYIERSTSLFESTNKTKYITDFKEFAFESHIEDFCDISNTEIVISTIHKAKGKEFDNVYMLLSSQTKPKEDDPMRQYYVGITRAKNKLFIHTDREEFNLQADKHNYDNKIYTIPDEIILPLSFTDVYLNFSKPFKQEILSLKSGEPLNYKDFILYDITNKPIAKLSEKGQDCVSKWIAKGYEIQSASVRFIMAWRPKDSPQNGPEYAIVLPDLVLSLK